MTRLILTAITILTFAWPGTAAIGYEPQWSPVIIATGEYRQKLQATPIEYRPNRPFHFYGNTVRRRHHTGSYLPSLNSVTRPFTGR